MAVKIVTACAQGLVRSVGLADVLKLHFEPVDVIPIGLKGNSRETIEMLEQWCNFFIIMEERYRARVPNLAYVRSKLLVCDVGEDRYGNSHNRELIDQCWQWARRNQDLMGIREHQRVV